MVDIAKASIKSLEAQEQVIARSLKSGMEGAKALRKINEEGLYTARGYTTFEKYCEDEWGISKRLAYYKIDASKTHDRIVALKLPLPQLESESQLRELTSVEDSDLGNVVVEALALAKKTPTKRVTVSLLKKAKEKILGKPKPKSVGKELVDRPSQRVESNVKNCSQNKQPDSGGSAELQAAAAAGSEVAGGADGGEDEYEDVPDIEPELEPDTSVPETDEELDLVECKALIRIPKLVDSLLLALGNANMYEPGYEKVLLSIYDRAKKRAENGGVV